MKKIIYLLLVLPLFFSAQNQQNLWFFSTGGLNFNSQPPTVITNTNVVLNSGSTFCDASGNLLFYTDGLTVWNKLHNVMANGSGLLGYSGGFQSGLTVQQPGNPDVYYVFCPNDFQAPTYYSVINMSMAAGMGSVTVKNASLAAGYNIKVAAVNHCNGKDVWVIFHEMASSNFRVHLLGATGLNTVAVVSSAGSTVPMGLPLGCIKASPTGKFLLSNFNTGSASHAVEMYEFNNATGIVSNATQLLSYSGGNTDSYITSCEFSSDGSKIYASQYKQITQWDLCAGSSSAIIASSVAVGVPTASNIVFRSGMQRGPDGKIYIGRALFTTSLTFIPTSTLAVINNPNSGGTACNFNDIGLNLGSVTSDGRFPQCLANLLKTPISIGQVSTCPTVSFTYPNTTCAVAGFSVTSFNWFFGDPASGTNNSSNLASPVHNFSSSGTYTVKLVLNYGACQTDTLIKVLSVAAPPTVTLSGRTSICKKESTQLVLNGANTYTWSTNINSNSITVSPTISTVYTYTATYTNSPCKSTNSVTVTVLPCTSIYNYTEFKSLMIYPNPAKDLIYFEKPDSEESEMHYVKFYNSIGQLSKEQTLNLSDGKATVNIADLPSGIYTIALKNSKPTISYQKIVISR